MQRFFCVRVAYVCGLEVRLSSGVENEEGTDGRTDRRMNRSGLLESGVWRVGDYELSLNKFMLIT